jgi:uncharacterized membrane protein
MQGIADLLAISCSTRKPLVRSGYGHCNFAGPETYYRWTSNKAGEALLNRYAVLYLATLIVLIPIDFLFLGVVARGFFAAQVGDMLGEIRPAPAILFYLLYVAGILIFVSGPATATWSSALIYGALFGLFCYATFELTSMSLLVHWSWKVVAVDISWGIIVSAISATSGLLIANWLVPRA